MKCKVVVDACNHIKDAHIKGRASKGQCACGVLIIDEQGNEHERSKFLGEMTTPEAEFNGLIFALDKLSEFSRGEIEVWMDSELVIKWMKGEYRMRKDHIRPLFDEAKKLENRYKSLAYFHHPRTTTLAKRADSIAEAEYLRNMQS